MPLRFKGEDRGATWVYLDAVNDAGDRVHVKVSREAAEKCGLDLARAAAQRKYAYRLFEPNGSILVRSFDCASPSSSNASDATRGLVCEAIR
jgi:hypothetical protein